MIITPQILVVEDNWIVSLDIQKKREQFGCLVVGTAASGLAAINSVSKLSPDLILMDINLDGSMDGIDAAYQIQKKFGLPIIFITAYSDDKTKQRAMRINPTAYIIKPYTDYDLMNSLNDVFGTNILN
jgi:CheY-like chemotaxis protein